MFAPKYITSYDQALRLFPTDWSKVRILLTLIFVLVFPFFASGGQLGLANLTLIYIIGALGLNVTTGFTGQISLGQGAFVGVGAFASAYFFTVVGMPFIVSVLCASVLTALVGCFFGIPSVRLKGLYLAIATLAAQFILEYIFKSWDSVTGGSSGMSAGAPEILGYEFDNDFSIYWLLLVVCTLCMLFVRNLRRTSTGRALMAVRDHDLAAEIMGINLFRTKVLAFGIGSFFAGLAGALWGHYVGYVTPEQFTLGLSISFLVMIIVGGLGSVLGSVLGALFVVLLPEVLNSTARFLVSDPATLADLLAYLRDGLFGVMIIVILITEPNGLAAWWDRVKTYWHLYPFAR